MDACGNCNGSVSACGGSVGNGYTQCLGTPPNACCSNGCAEQYAATLGFTPNWMNPVCGSTNECCEAGHLPDCENEFCFASGLLDDNWCYNNNFINYPDDDDWNNMCCYETDFSGGSGAVCQDFCSDDCWPDGWWNYCDPNGPTPAMRTGGWVPPPDIHEDHEFSDAGKQAGGVLRGKGTFIPPYACVPGGPRGLGTIYAARIGKSQAIHIWRENDPNTKSFMSDPNVEILCGERYYEQGGDKK